MLNSRSFATHSPFPVPATIFFIRPAETQHSEILLTPYAGINLLLTGYI